MSKVLCIFHAACADGLGAVWAVHRALGPEVEFVAAKYNNNPTYAQATAWMSSSDYAYDFPQFHNRDVLIVDFSYPLPVLRAMAQEARSVLVLDHHKTAQEDLSELPTPNEASRNWGADIKQYGDKSSVREKISE